MLWLVTIMTNIFIFEDCKVPLRMTYMTFMYPILNGITNFTKECSFKIYKTLSLLLHIHSPEASDPSLWYLSHAAHAEHRSLLQSGTAAAAAAGPAAAAVQLGGRAPSPGYCVLCVNYDYD